MDKHTTGPYDIDKSQPDCIRIISVETGRVVAIVTGTDDEAIANARLICGSVYLLKSLRSMLKLVEAQEGAEDSETLRICEAARVAIMVSTGQAD